MGALKLVLREIPVPWTRPGTEDAATFYAAPLSDTEELRCHVAHLDGPGPVTNERVLDHRAAVAVAAVVRWDGVVDEDGAPVPCEAEARALLFGRHRLAALAVYDALYPESGADRPSLPVAGSSSEAPAPGNGSPAEASSPETSEAAST